jgi:hypothetical protein
MRIALALVWLLALAPATRADEGCADIHAQAPADYPLPIAAGTRFTDVHDLRLSGGDWAVVGPEDAVGSARVRTSWGTLVLVPIRWPTNGAGILFVREREGRRCILGSWIDVFGGNGVDIDGVRVLGMAGGTKRRVEIRATENFHHDYEACTDEADGGDDVEDCHDGRRYVGGSLPVAVTVEVDRGGVRVLPAKAP